VASVQQNSREVNGWATGGKFMEYVEGAGKCYGLETSKQLEQNIKANQSRHTGQTELQPTPVKTVQYKQSWRSV